MSYERAGVKRANVQPKAWSNDFRVDSTNCLDGSTDASGIFGDGWCHIDRLHSSNIYFHKWRRKPKRAGQWHGDRAMTAAHWRMVRWSRSRIAVIVICTAPGMLGARLESAAILSGTISGTVLDEKAQPVANARVYAQRIGSGLASGAYEPNRRRRNSARRYRRNFRYLSRRADQRRS